MRWTHQCPGAGCTVQVRQSQLACRQHWSRVSRATRTAVWDAYRSGDTAAHMEAMADAITEMNTAARGAL